MKEAPQNPRVRLLAFIPHRDSARLLREYSRLLFSRGVVGARSLPVFAALAPLRRPLTKLELTALAATLRQQTLEPGRNGLFHSAGPAGKQPFAGLDGAFLLGPRLDVGLPDLPESAGTSSLGGIVLCVALLAGTDPLPTDIPDPPALSFRAAALANLLIYPLPSGAEPYSWVWEFGRPVWLPGVRP